MTQKIAVIGGGIVGSTAAFYLSKNQQDILLYDDSLGQATKAAAGIISPWLSQRRNKEWYHLAKSGAAFYQQLMTDLNLPDHTSIYQQTGTILYKKNQTLLDKLTHLAQTRVIEAPTIGEITQLSPDTIKELIPPIDSEQPALFISGGAKVDGQLLIKALQDSLQTIIRDRVTQIDYLNTGQWRIRTAYSENLVDKIILSVGAWLPELLTPLGYEVDIRPQKGQLIELQLSDDTTNWPVVMPVGEIDLIPFQNGRLVVGATHENDQGYDLTPDPNLLKHLQNSGAKWMPQTATLPIEKIRVGTRAYTSDFLPFFGEVTTLPNILVASGLGSSGLTTGPVIGKCLADWILENDTAFESYRYRPNDYIKKS
ncbi:FAD-dependent oxidoreductase [Vagococcus penaei]|uniref:FAD-dependent oxidoreductase n=1 Tax=Vagococcus penaei TaxID=633807 RepID=A0A1Q2D3X6_9ENTE|nr:FAD-binding oxidoreductase [Vagococcus penaei]AQP52987.1 FAD-dependent oxidoreductase [Vagococcus penaei]RSU02553.1 FAD-dependent oxidoreductase [Vagococcus penaei]